MSVGYFDPFDAQDAVQDAGLTLNKLVTAVIFAVSCGAAVVINSWLRPMRH